MMARTARSGVERGSAGYLHNLRLQARGPNESILEFVQYWANQRRQIMGGAMRRAYQQVAWVCGYQHHEWHEIRGALTDPADFGEVPWWQIHASENRLLGMVESRVTKLLSRQPIWRVPRVSDSEDDASVASLGTTVLQKYWRHVLNMYDKLWRAHWWAEVTGTAYLCAYWDPDAGPRLRVTPQDFIERPAEAGASEDDGTAFFEQIFGEGEVEALFHLGDARIGVNTIFDTLVDPTATCPEDVKWVLFQGFRSIDELQDRYGRAKTADLETSDAVTEEMPYFYEMMRLGAGANYNTIECARDQVLRYELWVRRSKKRPKGIHAVIAGDTVLNAQPIPYDHEQIPVVYIWGVPIPGCMMGQSKVFQLMETQKRLNKIRSNKTLYMEHHCFPKWLEPEFADVDDDSITTAWGERIRYSGIQPPVLQAPPAMPRYLDSLESDALQAFQDIGDVHEVTMAQAPEGVRSGRAILALQQQDDSRYVNNIRLRNGELCRLGGLVLSMLHQFVREDRLVRAVGDDEELDVFTFTGSQLVGPNQGVPGADYFYVETEIDSELPMSPEGQRTIVEGLLERGVLDPVQHRDLILRMVGMGSAEPALDAGKLHRSLARHENRLMAQGEMVLPQKWHDHVIHLAVLTRFMNTPEFGRLPEELRRLFELHRTLHYHQQGIETVRPTLTVQMASQLAPVELQNELREAQQAMGGSGELPEELNLMAGPQMPAEGESASPSRNASQGRTDRAPAAGVRKPAGL